MCFHRRETVKALNHVFIYCTNDKQRSMRPARRLEHIIKQHIKKAEVVVHQPGEGEDGKNPVDVYMAIKNWYGKLCAKGEDYELIINATGGLKTMFAGVLPFTAEEDTCVTYRDLDGCWLDISWRDGVYHSKKIEVSERKIQGRMKITGIKELIQMQSDFSELEIKKAPEMDCLESLRKVVEKNWQWGVVASKGESAGFVFENWFASLVSEFDVDEVVVGLSPKEDGRSQLETDVWVMNNGKLFMFDLKLINAGMKKSSLVEQITNASAAARKLAGLGVSVILVRPGYTDFNDEMKKTARQFGCEIWFQKDMRHLLERLKKLFGQPARREDKLNRLLESSYEKQRFVFSSPNGRYVNAFRKPDSHVNMSSVLKIGAENGERWISVSLDTGGFIAVVVEEDIEKLEGWGAVIKNNNCKFEIIGKRQIMIRPEGDKGKDFLKKNKPRDKSKPLFNF